MNRGCPVRIAFFIGIMFWCTAAWAENTHALVSDVMVPLDPGQIRIDGYLGKKLNLCLTNRVMSQEIKKVIRPFQLRQEHKDQGFRCEYWGKWFTSAVLGYNYQPTENHRTKIDQAVDALLATQTPDGYIGTYQAEYQPGMWDIWGRKYVLLGLIAYYDVTAEPEVLNAACRTADYLYNQVSPRRVNLTETGYPGWKGLPPSSILEPIVLLYQRTGKQQYLELANLIVQQWKMPNKLTDRGLNLIEDALKGVLPANMEAAKAYEMMSCYEGLCELYRVTGKKDYFDAVLKVANNIRSTELMIVGSGSNHELWCQGTRYQTTILEQPLETCVTVTWMKLCYQLMRLTGNSMWADEMEISLYNALLGSMMPDGRWWSYYCPLIGQRVPSHPQHTEIGLSCCVANGPRALLLVPRWAVMTTGDGVAVNLYAPSEATIAINGQSVKILQQTDYPINNYVKLTVQPEKPVHFTLWLRIPHWSRQTSLNVNGQAYKCQPGTYAKIQRQWEPGDQVNLNLDLRGRVIRAPSQAPQKAVMRGPVVLAMDNRLAKPLKTAVRLITDEEGYVELKPFEDKPEDIFMAFEVAFEIHEIHVVKKLTKLVMCDFASAGNQYSAGNLYRVWLPQPLYLDNMYPHDTWKLMYPQENLRPSVP